MRTYSPPATPATTITPGSHVIGSDITAGTYSASVASGCYWERNTSFSGDVSDIIANDLISSAGTAYVTISPTDVGFYADDDCGTWARV
jgi:hypothetical protein